MSDELNHENPNGHGSFERRDIGIAGVLYFLVGLAVAGVLVHFVVSEVYSFLEKRNEVRQAPVSPLVTNLPADTRHLPSEYKTDSESADYEKYLEKKFPAPQLETSERLQLNKFRLDEAQILNTYDWVDKDAKTVRIPIDRAMDLIAQRGLPQRGQANPGVSIRPAPATSAPAKKKKAKK